MGERLQTFAGEDVPLYLARAWAEQTRQSLKDCRDRRRTYIALDRAYERGEIWESGYEVTEDQVNRAVRAVWTSEVLLVISAWTLDVWMTKLYRARRRKKRTENAQLNQLRNALMHLDSGEIDEEAAFVAANPKNSRSKHGLGALPDGGLSVGVDLGFSVDSKLFGILTLDEIEALAAELIDELNQEFDDLMQSMVAFMQER